MAPPSRRKQRPAPSTAASSSPSPIPLAGVAFGLFAAIAAGFAASRAFRKRRPARLQEQAIPAGKDSSIPLPVQDREIEIKDKIDPKPFPLAAVINGTIAVPHEPANLGLNPVFEACEEASIQEKNGAKASEEGGEGGGGGGEEEEEEEGGGGGGGEEEEVKRAETDEEGNTGEGEEEEGEEEGGGGGGGEEEKVKRAETDEEGKTGEGGGGGEEEEVKRAETDEEGKTGEGEEEEEEEEEEGGGGGGEEEEEVKRAETDEEGKTGEGEGEAIQITVEVNAVVVNEASMEALQEANLVEEKEEEENDDDDDTLAEQQPSPVLINVRVLDFNEEIIADSKDDHDRLSSGSYSISDALSECSLQEVSSAPVKPLPAEEAQITWPETKPDFVVAEEEVEVEEDAKEGKLWPDLEENSPELENNLPELENSSPQMEKNLPDLNHDWPESKQSLPDSKPVSVEADGELLDLKPVWVEIKEEGVSAEKLNRPNNEAMSGLVDVKGDGLVLEGEVSVDIGSGKRVLEAVGINGEVLSDEQPEIEAPDFSQPDELSTSKAISDGEPDLQLAQEGSDDTGFSTKGEPSLQSVKEGSDENTGSSTNGEPNLQLAQEGTSASGDPLEELGNGGPLEEPVLQSHGQNLDSVDGTCVDNPENNLDTEQDQPSSSTEAKACGEEISSGTKDDDGPTETLRGKLKPRIHVHQQEIEELENDQIFESKKLASSTNGTLVYGSNTREADQLAPSAIAQGVVLQKGGFQSKIREFAPYLPLEMGLICLLIALVSLVLWYLGISSPGQE